MPQKLTTTACFIQEESSGGKQFRKHWLCTLVFEIYFSTLKHEAISIRVFTEKHPYTIKGQLFEEFNRKSGKRTEAHEVES